MNKDKETKKLGSEDLAKRVAPLTTPIYTETTTDPTTTPSTSSGSSTDTGTSSEALPPRTKTPFKKADV